MYSQSSSSSELVSSIVLLVVSHGQQGSIEHFDLAIPLWMVRGGAGAVNPTKSPKIFSAAVLAALLVQACASVSVSLH